MLLANKRNCKFHKAIIIKMPHGLNMAMMMMMMMMGMEMGMGNVSVIHGHTSFAATGRVAYL